MSSVSKGKTVAILLALSVFLFSSACDMILPTPGDDYIVSEEIARVQKRFTDSFKQGNNDEKEDNLTLKNENSNTLYGDSAIYGNNDKLSTVGFAIRHPLIAQKIGEVKEGQGNTNISTNSSRFANAFDFTENKSGEGSEVNAVRHTIWIATITNKWGEDIALQVGNAHEKDQNSLVGLDVYNYKFDSLTKADEAIDLLNNTIGREIGGVSAKGATMKDITKDVLNYYYNNGLNIANEKDGGYIIVKEKISKERYEEALRTLETLDDNGFPPGNEYFNKK